MGEVDEVVEEEVVVREAKRGINGVNIGNIRGGMERKALVLENYRPTQTRVRNVPVPVFALF